MYKKTIHRYLGIFITIFIFIHLLNHSMIVYGPQFHIEWMNSIRPIYRNIIMEFLLLFAICLQIILGFRLSVNKLKTINNNFDKLLVYSGWYLAFFFIIHLSAILFARAILHLDTNIYFGIAGLNTFPLNLFFIPYYFLAIIALTTHFSAIHRHKMQYSILGINPNQQSIIILFLGLIFATFLMYSLTNKFQYFNIHYDYKILK